MLRALVNRYILSFGLKVQKEYKYKGGDWQFPQFLSFPSKGSPHADLGWNVFPRDLLQIPK